MKLVFMGTSLFAVPALEVVLNSSNTIAGVITQPDRPAGRGGKLSPSPVKQAALTRGLEIYQPDNIKTSAAVQQVLALEPELIVVVSYGQIIPPAILEYPVFGCINIHASLLPRYRGAAPIQRALMAGEKVTGVTIMYMDAGLDTGDIIMQMPVEIALDMDHGELERELAGRGAGLLLAVMGQLEAGIISRNVQDNAQATYAHRLSGEDEIIDWALPAGFIHNRIRAMSPKPGAYTIFDGVKIKLFRSRVIDRAAEGRMGEVLRVDDEGFWIQTGNGILEVREVQKEGKKRMPVREFLKGSNLKTGALLV